MRSCAAVAGAALALCVHQAAAAESTAYYVGCFHDNEGGRDLVDASGNAQGGSVTDSAGFDTVMECAIQCDGFTYMGLQWVNECYCGNVYGAQEEAEATDCDTDGVVADGEMADLCGNGNGDCGNRNAIYTVAQVMSMRAPPAPAPHSKPHHGSSQYYVGCFHDNEGGRDLTDEDGAAGITGPVTAGAGFDTVTECAMLCTGYTYMGLQWVNECYCGNNYGTQEEADATDCDSDGIVDNGDIADLCGDGTQACGNRNAIYTVSTVLEMSPPGSTDPTTPPVEGTQYYIGCFHDNEGGRDLTDDGGAAVRGAITAGAGFDSVAECAALCDGFRYMGLQYTNECFCGNVYGAQEEAAATDCDTDGIVPDGEMADLCGDGGSTCGNRNAIYTVVTVAGMSGAGTAPTPAPTSYYVGCFHDNEGGRDLMDAGGAAGLGPSPVTAGGGHDTGEGARHCLSLRFCGHPAKD